MELGELAFEPLDFSRAELQRAFGDNADWFYKRLAQIVNDELRERIGKMPTSTCDIDPRLSDAEIDRALESPPDKFEWECRMVCFEKVIKNR